MEEVAKLAIVVIAVMGIAFIFLYVAAIHITGQYDNLIYLYSELRSAYDDKVERIGHLEGELAEKRRSEQLTAYQDWAREDDQREDTTQ
jgi:predicted PurR-regulated permease PerM